MCLASRLLELEHCIIGMESLLSLLCRLASTAKKYSFPHQGYREMHVLYIKIYLRSSDPNDCVMVCLLGTNVEPYRKRSSAQFKKWCRDVDMS